ncbi:MAG: TolC family protein [Thermoanaerobaculaceae bacterium]|nr:TolC family protein [Thermoanaerobaculaceae bacterium]
MRTLALLLAWGVVGASALPAQPTTPPGDPNPAPPIEELLKLALERSPSLQALRQKLAGTREMVAPAGALPDPMVEIMLQDAGFPKYTVGSMEMSMVGPEVRQTLPYPGKRDARRALVRAEVAVQVEELESLQRQLAAGVRALYGRAYALDQERAVLSAARELLEMLAATAATRYSVGEAEQEAVIKAQIEVSRLEERSDDLDAERAVLVAALNRLLDEPGTTPLGRVASLPPIEVPAAPWEEAVLASSAEVAARRASVTTAQRRLELLRLDLKPDFATGAAVGLRGGFDPVVTLRFGVELPFWRKEKQQPMIRAAEHELEMARAEVREAEAAARSEATRLRAEWERAERQIVRYREALIPQSSAAVDAARSSYLAGRGDFSTVIEDFRLWLEARSELARREADRFMTWAELDALIETPSSDEAIASTRSPEPALNDRGAQ